MQVLSHTYEFNIFLENETYKNKLNKIYDSAIIVEWDNLRKIMWSSNCIVSPGKFIKTIQKVSQLKKWKYLQVILKMTFQNFYYF